PSWSDDTQRCGERHRSHRGKLPVFPTLTTSLPRRPVRRIPMTLDDLCSRLLPPDEHLHFETLLLEDYHLTLVAAMTAPKALCPDCHQPSPRIHSGYPRTLADLPWATMPVELRLQVRRFFCDTPRCERTTFTERLPTVAPLYARTTTR